MAKRRKPNRTRNLQPAKAQASAVLPPPPSNGTPAVVPVLPPAPALPCHAMSDEVYRDERNILLDLIKGNTEQHDKSVLQLATAVLGLTITFKDKIAPQPLPGTDWLMGISWLLLLGSTGTMLASFITGERACKLDLKNLDARYLNYNAKPIPNHWATATSVCN
jgi:hypothetical protein